MKRQERERERDISEAAHLYLSLCIFIYLFIFCLFLCRLHQTQSEHYSELLPGTDQHKHTQTHMTPVHQPTTVTLPEAGLWVDSCSPLLRAQLGVGEYSIPLGGGGAAGRALWV